MDPIEQRVRESLRARAGDAEPTPHLYRGVQDRIARRRRLKVMTWVPAGAAALGVAVAIPFVLSGDPEVPRIEDYADEQPTSAATPDRAVVYDVDGDLRILDLRDGSVTESGVQTPPQDRLAGLAVPAGDRGDDPAWVALEHEPGRGPTWTIHRPGIVEVSAGFPGVIVDGGMAVSDDGGWVAYLTEAEEADGYVVTVANTLLDGEMEIHTVANVSEDARILDWAGSTDGTTRAPSEILVATANGTLTSFPILATGEGLTAAGDSVTVAPVAEVLAASLTHLDAARPTASRFQLEQDRDRRILRLVGDSSGEVDVTTLVGGADPADLWLDAWGDATLLGDGTDVWLLRHDGEGNFAEPVALPEGTVRAALVGKDVAAAPVDEGLEPDDGEVDEVPGDEDGTVDEVQEIELPGAIVVTTANAVVLRRADGSEQDLLRYPPPPEGEGMNLAAAVRPGSSSGDLTVVVARLSEGLTDLRWIEVVDGEVREPAVLEGAYAPTSATDPQVAVEGLAWTPDGAKVLWLERRTDGDVQLRSIGWADGPGTGDPATDNAAFAMPEVFPATLVDVRDAGGGRLVARFAPEDADDGWYRWILEVQGDGALAAPGTAPEKVAAPASAGGVVALTGADEESRPTWLLRFEAGEPRLVADPYGRPRDLPAPDGVWSGEALPSVWLHDLGDGVLVGGDGQLWFVDRDGEANALAEAMDADPVR